MLRPSGKIDLENVNHPGQIKRVDANMYEAMKRAFLKILLLSRARKPSHSACARQTPSVLPGLYDVPVKPRRELGLD